jgi:putative transposase
MDNLFIKRPWKRVKYEDVYLKTYSSPGEMRKGRSLWYDRYNTWRRHKGACNPPPLDL